VTKKLLQLMREREGPPQNLAGKGVSLFQFEKKKERGNWEKKGEVGSALSKQKKGGGPLR